MKKSKKGFKMLGIVAERRRDRAGGARSVNDIVNYILRLRDEAKEEKILDVWYRNILDESPQGAMYEMKFHLAQCSVRTPYCMEHLILTWPANENPKVDDIKGAADYVLEKMGLSDNQAVMSLHKDTNNLHLHMAVNRYNSNHKLVDTGGGWYVNLMHKCSRELELRYDWQFQTGGIYEIQDGEVVKASEKTRISRGAKNFETYTGQASEERKLQMVCSKIFNLAKSWPEIHEELAKQGVVLNQKGSGGILLVNNIEVKLSSIGRDYSFGRLVKKFGEFEPAKDDISVKPDPASIFNQAMPIIATNSWAEYTEARKIHYERYQEYKNKRQEAIDKYRLLRNKTVDELAEKFEKEWQIFNAPKDTFYNKRQEYKYIVAKHRSEQYRMKKSLGKVKNEVYSSWPARPYIKFPSYQQWLDSRRDQQNYNADYDLYYNRRSMGVIEPLDENAGQDPAAAYLLIGLAGIQNFRMNRSVDKGYLYFEQTNFGLNGVEKNDVAFVDYGKLVKIYIESDEAILAAMQLGKAKAQGLGSGNQGGGCHRRTASPKIY